MFFAVPGIRVAIPMQASIALSAALELMPPLLETACKLEETSLLLSDDSVGPAATASLARHSGAAASALVSAAQLRAAWLPDLEEAGASICDHSLFSLFWPSDGQLPTSRLEDHSPHSTAQGCVCFFDIRPLQWSTTAETSRLLFVLSVFYRAIDVVSAIAVQDTSEHVKAQYRKPNMVVFYKKRHR